jgi:proteasome lid subunit RPN8/RPN11
VDPKDLLRIYRDIDGNGWDVLAIYHSHTHTEAYPSPTDVRLAAWPEAYYVIVSLADEANPVLRAFRIEDGQVTEEELTVA